MMDGRVGDILEQGSPSCLCRRYLEVWGEFMKILYVTKRSKTCLYYFKEPLIHHIIIFIFTSYSLLQLETTENIY
jgi:hypothetical protein